MSKELLGGQAVIEGVMMRSQQHAVTAVRTPNGKIVLRKETIKPRPGLWKLPFFRGMYNIIEMLAVGMRALIWSGNQSLPKEEQEPMRPKDIVLLIVISFAFGIFLFVALPYLLTFMLGLEEESRPIIFNIVDSVIKIVIFIAYLLLIARMADVKKLFQYHGAEHQSVHCLEAKLHLTVKNVQKFNPEHPRCGTSFLILVIIVAIIVLSLLPVAVMYLFPGFVEQPFLLRRLILFTLRILMIAPIAGIAYELLRFSATHQGSVFFRLLSAPGMWTQLITTKKPTNKQVEVAIQALQEVLRLEKTNIKTTSK